MYLRTRIEYVSIFEYVLTNYANFVQIVFKLKCKGYSISFININDTILNNKNIINRLFKIKSIAVIEEEEVFNVIGHIDAHVYYSLNITM